MVFVTASDMLGKTQLEYGLKKSLALSPTKRRGFSNKYISLDDRDYFEDMITSGKNPQLTQLVNLFMQQNEEGKMQQNWENLLDDMANKRGRLYLITGGKGSGKTCFSYFLCEKLFEKYGERIWWFGPPTELPDFVEGCTLNENNLPPVCTIICDEAGIQFWSRMSGGNTDDFLRKLPVLRHTSRNAIVISQSMSIMDLSFVRLADGIFYKTYSVFQNQTERLKISDELKLFMPNINEKDWTLFYDNERIQRFKFTLPEWWSENYSKPYRHFKDKSEMYIYIIKLIKDGIDNEKIIEQTQLRGQEVDDVLIRTIQVICTYYGIEELLKMKPKQLLQTITEGFDDTPLQNVLVGEEHTGIKGNFEMPPVQEEYRKQREENDTFRLMSHIPVNTTIAADMRWRNEHEGNVIASVYGMPGTGKSALGIAYCETLQRFNGRPFTVERIKCSNDDLAGLLKKSKKGDAHMKDENPSEWGEGSGRAAGEVRNIEEAIRKQQKHFVFVSPELQTYHLHHYIFETWGIDFKLDLIKALVYIPSNLNIPLGYVVFKFPKKKLWKEYNVMKDKFLEKVENRTTNKKEYQEGIAREMMANEKFNSLKTQKQKEAYISYKKSNLTGEEIKKILAMTAFLEFEDGAE